MIQGGDTRGLTKVKTANHDVFYGGYYNEAGNS